MTKNREFPQFGTGCRQIRMLMVTFSLEMRYGIVQGAGNSWLDSLCSPVVQVPRFTKHAGCCCLNFTPQPD